MAEVIILDEYRPCLLVELADSVHVIPMRLIEDLAEGKIDCDTKTAQCLAAFIVRDFYGD